MKYSKDISSFSDEFQNKELMKTFTIHTLWHKHTTFFEMFLIFKCV